MEILHSLTLQIREYKSLQREREQWVEVSKNGEVAGKAATVPATETTTTVVATETTTMVAATETTMVVAMETTMVAEAEAMLDCKVVVKMEVCKTHVLSFSLKIKLFFLVFNPS